MCSQTGVNSKICMFVPLPQRKLLPGIRSEVCVSAAQKAVCEFLLLAFYLPMLSFVFK